MVNKRRGSVRLIQLAMAFVFAIASVPFFPTSSASAAQGLSQVSTGEATACAVKDGKVKCWGDNSQGQLGNRSKTTSTTPVDVYAVKDPAPIKPSPCGGWFQPSCTPVPQPSSPLGGKTVQKVSVGRTHACALASARVYCWGDNSKGQLGDRTNDDSSMPVAVDIQADDVTPPAVKPSPCGGWFQPSCTPVPQPVKPKSSLGNKEVVDITAGDDFTCALASDGTVSCWGYGDSGRLGNDATVNKNFPQAVYSQGAFATKKGVKLAKASGSTMCVLTVDKASTSANSTGTPYCWGTGIDNGTALPANKQTTVACGSSSPRTNLSTTTETTIFQSAKPVEIPGETFKDMDGGDYITGLATNGRAYYWGMYGYVGTTSASNVTTCSIKSCTGAAPTVYLARYNHGTGGNTTGGHNNQNSQGQNIGGNKSPVCTNTTHYGYTKNTIYGWTGQKAATTPPAWSSSQNGLTAVSGDVFSGLYCATTGGTANCDVHGTSAAEGQTGSGYTQQCTTTGIIFTTTKCQPDPTGPQSVKYDGWLQGKTVRTLNTGASGYTCAVTTENTLGCWGVNAKGQLGNGTTKNKNVPTKVDL